jgi:predicted polyphosphate/ATP-dependent NAD kinase
MQKKVGLIVNPVAGMGGSVGLKGTDSGLHIKAIEMGALPVTPQRASDLLSHINNIEQIQFLVAPGEMGEQYVADILLPKTVIGEVTAITTAEDTKRISKEMIQKGAELIIFVGGDGTARDIVDSVSNSVPVVAVPAGVKVFSAVFALSIRAAAGMIDAFLSGCGLTEEEVLDIDEEAYRDNRLSSRLYGYLFVPDARQYLQPGKSASDINISVAENKEDIAAYIVEGMDLQVLYLLGPGTTVRAITDEMGLQKTLLGIDAVYDGRIIGADLNEQAILGLLTEYPKREIIVTPIGGNGFIFGRGSKQFTPQVLRLVGRKNYVVVANIEKAMELKNLRVDTGDDQVDAMLCGYSQVVVGYKEKRMMQVVS